MRPKLFLWILLLLMACSGFAYNFGQNKVNLKPEQWSTIQTMHFDIYFPAGYPDFGKLVALMAEETYYSLRSDLQFPINSRIPIIFYGSKSQFQSTNIIYPLLTEGVGGFTESLRNRVVIPFDGSYRNLEELLVHELTHAYTNSLDKGITNSLLALRPVSFPFWFSEGLPEFLSIGGHNDYNNMFILDMVVNDYQVPLDNLEGYYAYRLGESFLAFIADTYGREKVSDYYFALRSSNNLESATKKVFGMEFKDLQSRWRYQLKRDYYPLVNQHGIPKEDMEQRTFSDKDGSYFNFMPRFAPNGERFVYFSSAGARYSIMLAGLHGPAKPDNVFKGEATGKAEEFYYFRSNLSWFPDNQRVAFAAKTSEGDRIHILDVDREKIVQTIAPAGFDALYELDVAPGGEAIVFAGQQGMQCDLFLYDLASQSITQLTDDLYNDAQPRFSPDGKNIVFASERSRDLTSNHRGFFANVVTDIFSLELDSRKMQQLTTGTKDCSFPMFDGSGSKILYLSFDNGINNYHVLDLVTSGTASMTNVLSGVFAGDISKDNQYLVVADFFDRAWNIYFTTNPLTNLVYTDSSAIADYSMHKDLLDDIDLGQLDYFGKRKPRSQQRINPANQYDSRRPLFGEASAFSFTREDSLRLVRDFSYDDRPTTIDKAPEVQRYKTKFSLDSIWGGLAYSSSVGTIGYVELSMSDLMGNHGIGINAGVSGKLEESNILLTYLYLKHRMDYGLGVYNLVDEVIYRDAAPTPNDYYRYRQRQTGLYFLLRYPFSRFFRVEFDHMICQRGQYWSPWKWDTADTGHWVDDEAPEQDFVYTPGLTLVHDNSLSGSTGPLVGWRGMYMVKTTLADGKLDYLTNYLDWRSYTLFSKRYAIALRAIAGVSTGKHPQRFDLGGYYGVRAYDGDLTGEKKAVLSAELRFPFFEYINMAFPVPLNIPNIRGSIFSDLGTVFDDFSDLEPMENGKLKDLYMSYGFGPRLDLGYVVLRLDIAWLTDLSQNSKPTYYLSLSEDF